MHNPFVLYSEKLLTALLKAGHQYFVRQQYTRGLPEGDAVTKGSFLITHYNQLNKARIHFEALPNNGNRFLYFATNSDHLQRLTRAAVQPSGYRIYAPLLMEEWQPPAGLHEKIRRYINSNLPWKPRASDNVRTNLFVEFGDLFLTLSLRGYQEKVPLLDIEMM